MRFRNEYRRTCRYTTRHVRLYKLFENRRQARNEKPGSGVHSNSRRGGYGV